MDSEASGSSDVKSTRGKEAQARAVDWGEVGTGNSESQFTLANKKSRTEDRRQLQGSFVIFKE